MRPVCPTLGLHVLMCQDEVYDLIADPYETKNLVGMPAYLGVVTALDERLASWAELALPFEDPRMIPTLAEYAGQVLEVSGAASILPAVSSIFKARCPSHWHAVEA